MYRPIRECKPLTQWWNPELLEYLPFAMDIGRKTCSELTRIVFIITITRYRITICKLIT